MEYLTLVVSWLSEKTGVDQWVVAGALFMIVGLLGKTSVRGAIAWVAGEHKSIGEIAQGILALMDTLNNWQINSRNDSRIESGDIVIDPRGRVVFVDRIELNHLNRRERRLIFAKAREIKGALDERQQRKLREQALTIVRNCGNRA
jgi:hypothetical protein